MTKYYLAVVLVRIVLPASFLLCKYLWFLTVHWLWVLIFYTLFLVNNVRYGYLLLEMSTMVSIEMTSQF